MSVDSLPSSLLAVAGILLLSTSGGWIVGSVLFPRHARWTLERWGWGMAVAVFFLAANVLVAFSLRLRPGWISFLALLIGGAVGLAKRFRLPRSDRAPEAGSWSSPVCALLIALTAAGVLMYLVRSLAEPMWSNDFLAVWGLKGKTIYGDAAIPQRLFRWPEFQFSNPAYPIGLPLVYAGIAFLLGRWDDHALALAFPFFQIGTLLVLVGWLRRRGVPPAIALAASAFAANFSLLYSAWLTGMAEVPAAFAFLLVGTALWDVLDDTDPGAARRLFLASLLAAALKNEGIFLVATACLLLIFRAVRRRDRKLWIGVAAVLIPGLGSVLLHRLFLGSHTVRGLDLELLWRPGLVARIGETVREEWTQLVKPIWPGIVAIIVLQALGHRRAAANPILILAAASLATYMALPVLCPFGPGWLVHWTVGRIASALVPLIAAGIGMSWRDSVELDSADRSRRPMRSRRIRLAPGVSAGLQRTVSSTERMHGR